MPARNISLQFALLSVQAKLSSAVQTKSSNVNLCTGQPGHDKHNPEPLTAPKKCAACGEITDYDGLKKGVKTDEGYAVLTQDQIAETKAEFVGEHKGVVNLIAHPSHEVLSQTVPGDKISYVVPKDAAATKHYHLLLKLVREHPEIAFTSLYTPVSVTSMFILQERDGALVLVERVRTQDLREAPPISPEVGAQFDQLYEVLEKIAGTTTTPYEAEAYEDKYAVALQALASEADVVQVGSAAKPAAPRVTDENDLLAKLQALVA